MPGYNFIGESGLFCSLFLLLFGLLIYKFCDSGGQKEVVPREYFLDVVGVDAVFVEIGKHLFEVSTQGGIVGECFKVDGFGVGLGLDGVKHLSQRNIFVECVYGDVSERYYFVVRIGRGALSVSEGFNYQHVFTLAHELE